MLPLTEFSGKSPISHFVIPAQPRHLQFPPALNRLFIDGGFREEYVLEPKRAEAAIGHRGPSRLL